jgi:hypothetical protein
MPTARAKKSQTARPPSFDARVAALLEALKRDSELAPVARAFEENAASGPAARKFGSNGLKVDGKLFALFTQGTLVVKLPRQRVAELVDTAVGTPFDPGHGRLMKEWLTVAAPGASWLDLTKEAFSFVRATRR